MVGLREAKPPLKHLSFELTEPPLYVTRVTWPTLKGIGTGFVGLYTRRAGAAQGWETL